MALKAATYLFKGMNKDLSNINADELFAYEIRNMRITPDTENTFLSISTIKGTKDTDIYLKGVPIGEAIVDDEWVVFCTGVEGMISIPNIEYNELNLEVSYIETDAYINSKRSDDYIYVLGKNNGNIEILGECKGLLKFSEEYPLETMSFIESETLKKVYWTDGINLPRFITIDRIKLNKDITEDEINFVSDIKESKEELYIEKDSSVLGMFPSGTTQYAFTYINYYGQLSNIFCISSLYYNTDKDKSLNINEVSSDAYKITLSDINSSQYDYIRIYSIVRSLKDGTPQVKVVTDYNIKEKDKLQYTDRNTSGYIIDPTELFYIGGELLLFLTMALKENTLFVGNITKIKLDIPKVIADKIKGKGIIKFEYDSNKIIKEEAKDQYYKQDFQLNKPSKEITTFKCGDYYRFGVLFLHKSGRWSNPIWLGDVCNDKYPKSEISEDELYHTHKIVSAYCNMSSLGAEVIDSIKNEGYIKARPVIVYPQFWDRKTLCQGYVSPTIYNANSRLENDVWVLSSWFARPWYKEKYGYYLDSDDWENNIKLNPHNEDVNGAIVEFNHNHIIGGPYSAHQELLSGYNGWNYEKRPLITPILDIDNSVTKAIDYTTWKNWFGQHYFVDSSIVTFHSPELEFDDSFKTLDLNNYKFKIIGYVPLTSFQGDVDIITSTAPLSLEAIKDQVTDENGYGLNYEGLIITGDSDYNQLGFFKNIKSSRNYSELGNRILCSGVFYKEGFLYNHRGEEPSTPKLPIFDKNTNKFIGYRHTSVNSWGDSTNTGFKSNKNRVSTIGYNIYPFHSDGYIKEGIDAKEFTYSSNLLYKKLSNVRYSYGSIYNLSESYKYDTYDKKLFYFDLDINITLKTKYNDTKIYKGNVDTLGTSVWINESNKDYTVGVMNFTSPMLSISVPGGNLNSATDESFKTLNTELFKQLPVERLPYNLKNRSIPIRYKSSVHAVMSLKASDINKDQILPVVGDNNPFHWNMKNTHYLAWEKNNHITEDYSYDKLGKEHFAFSGLWLGELYQDFTEDFINNNLFGGLTDRAFANNNWIIAGDDIDLNLYNRLVYTEGDTYYLRYDNLKTFPYSLEEINGVTDVISFMVETKVNLNGKYNEYKADNPHFHIFDYNFNLLNHAYTQNNNFFNYYGTDYSRIQENSFPNIVSWSKTKISGDVVDTWLNMNLSSTLELDGNYGNISSINNVGGNILVLQDKALNHVLYNELVLVSTENGMPIELANSGKVTGNRIISNNIGCSNKYSVLNTLKGLYFLDSKHKSLYLYGGEGLNNISLTYGFNTYIRKIDNINSIWNAKDYKSIKTSYDSINKEVLFNINKEGKKETLVFSEILNSFMSFYDWNTYYLASLNEDSYLLGNTLKDSDQFITPVYGYQQGEHNKYGHSYLPYYVEFISNPNPLVDKTFNVLEFRSDSYNKAGSLESFNTFNCLTVSNEYQSGKSRLLYNTYGLSNLRKKFRIWKADIPRDRDYKLDRIRNTWAKIKLESDLNNKNLNTILYDITVHYSI